MEQIEQVKPTVICKYCNNLGYFSYECDNDNKDTEICCPLCKKINLLDIVSSNSALYCSNCKTIVSQSWCMRGHNGCSFDVHYGMWFEIDGFIPIFANVFLLNIK